MRALLTFAALASATSASLLAQSMSPPAPAIQTAVAATDPTLAELLACNDQAVGGASLRAMNEVEYDLHIVEPTFEVDGVYRATRSGTARIDIYAGDTRVFSEGWDGSTGWQLPQDADEPIPTSPEGGAALWHGLELPGHLWTFADLGDRGHTVTLDPDPNLPPSEEQLHVTLTDGFEAWYVLDRGTCLITRKRDFRAFHPDVDPEEIWIETHFSDFREASGVTRAWTTTNVNATTGDTIGVTTLRAVRGG